MKLSDLNKSFEKNCERYICELKEFLAFPSISADMGNDEDCADCARWLSDHLQSIGLDSQLLATDTKPVVFAERKGLADSPVILFYGHYDVQPVDPIEKWDTPPFDATVIDGRIYARGAQDNKGQLFYVIKAIETLLENNSLDCTIKIIIEGEEESGCQAITAGLPKWKNMLQADVLLVTDTGTVPDGSPTIIMGLRGLVHLNVTLSGLTRDLHSGMHGGAAPNPAMELAKLLSSLLNSDGSIAVKHYYDNVTGPTEREKELANSSIFDPLLYEQQTGVPPVGGETAFTPLERIGFRPSMDINGMLSGYTGEGVKTIIPSSASAKITSRLVPGQNPDECLEQIISHLKEHAPTGLKLTISETGSAGEGFKLDPESKSAKIAQEVLNELSDKKTAFLWEGASIPIVSKLADTAGAEPLLVGFGSDADSIHAPNESFSINQFRMGYLYAARILRAL